MRFFGLVTPKLLLLPRVYAKGSMMVGISLIFLLMPFQSLKLQQKRAFLLGRPPKRRYPMEDVLKRRNFNKPNWCFVCLEEVEMSDHLLIHCRWVSSLWHYCLSLIGVLIGSTFLRQWHCGGMEKERTRIGLVVFGWWFLWQFSGVLGKKKRNRLNFEGKALSWRFQAPVLESLT